MQPEWTQIDEAFVDGIACAQGTMDDLLGQCALMAKQNRELQRRLRVAEEPRQWQAAFIVALMLLCGLQAGVIVWFWRN